MFLTSLKFMILFLLLVDLLLELFESVLKFLVFSDDLPGLCLYLFDLFVDLLRVREFFLVHFLSDRRVGFHMLHSMHDILVLLLQLFILQVQSLCLLLRIVELFLDVFLVSL